MSQPKPPMPVEGDVFMTVEPNEDFDPSQVGFFARLLEAMWIRKPGPQQPSSYVQMRLVTEVRRNIVFWRDALNLPYASWLTEWQDYQLGATQLALAGIPIAPDKLEAACGLQTLPYDLSKYQETKTND